MKHLTEEVYDNEMAPLIAKLIEIAERDNIPLFIDAGMFDENGVVLSCTTRIFPNNTGLELIVKRHSICLAAVFGRLG